MKTSEIKQEAQKIVKDIFKKAMSNKQDAKKAINASVLHIEKLKINRIKNVRNIFIWNRVKYELLSIFKNKYLRK